LKTICLWFLIKNQQVEGSKASRALIEQDSPVWRAFPNITSYSRLRQVLLPITTPPPQIPRLASAGTALCAADYSSTEQRRRVLWVEFDRPPDNPRDAYFVRLLAYAPDPALLRVIADPNDSAEPPAPIDPEPIRTIVPGQSDDRSGIPRCSV
jgi:hypothetical protein